MDLLSTEEPAGGERVELFTSEDLHKYLLGRDVPPELLPKKIDLNNYTAQMDQMYQDKTQVGKRPNPKNVLEAVPIFGERGCTSFVESGTQTIQFSPVIHDTEESVTRDIDDLMKQNKRPLVDMHTHPRDQLFSPNDLSILLKRAGEGRIVKAALVLCPSIQVLALTSTETPLFDEDTVDRILFQYKLDNLMEPETEEDKDQWVKKAVIRSRGSRADKRLGELLITKKITLEQYMEKIKEIQARTDKFADEITTAQLDSAKQKTNQWLLNFAYTNGIKLYASTNRKDFTEFTA